MCPNAPNVRASKGVARCDLLTMGMGMWAWAWAWYTHTQYCMRTASLSDAARHLSPSFATLLVSSAPHMLSLVSSRAPPLLFRPAIGS